MKWVSAGGGKSVQDVVDYMISKGLRFAPATTQDDAAYRAFFSAFAAYNVALNAQDGSSEKRIGKPAELDGVRVLKQHVGARVPAGSTAKKNKAWAPCGVHAFFLKAARPGAARVGFKGLSANLDGLGDRQGSTPRPSAHGLGVRQAPRRCQRLLRKLLSMFRVVSW